MQNVVQDRIDLKNIFDSFKILQEEKNLRNADELTNEEILVRVSELANYSRALTNLKKAITDSGQPGIDRKIASNARISNVLLNRTSKSVNITSERGALTQAFKKIIPKISRKLNITNNMVRNSISSNLAPQKDFAESLSLENITLLNDIRRGEDRIIKGALTRAEERAPPELVDPAAAAAAATETEAPIFGPDPKDKADDPPVFEPPAVGELKASDKPISQILRVKSENLPQERGAINAAMNEKLSFLLGLGVPAKFLNSVVDSSTLIVNLTTMKNVVNRLNRVLLRIDQGEDQKDVFINIFLR